MKEQAEKQNRNFEDIVAERYGVSTGINKIGYLQLHEKPVSLTL